MTYFNYVTNKRGDSLQSKNFMTNVANDLYAQCATGEPVSLLGLIQSGKTRSFVGVMAKCFDMGFDAVVLFTKVSKALVDQTIQRMKDEFEAPLKGGQLHVWNAIKLQESMLTPYMMSQKNIFVTKKEKANMMRLQDLFNNKLFGKRVLIVDDEADATSVGYKDSDTLAVISDMLSNIRAQHKGLCAYLQVTATPYSLYLQPDSEAMNKLGYSAVRPQFTHILDPHSAYVGGQYYFEDAMDPESPAWFLFNGIEQAEMDFLNKKTKTTVQYNKKVLDNILFSPSIKGFRDAILNFLVGGAIRYIEEETNKSESEWGNDYKCAFLVHTNQSKNIHKMQCGLVEWLVDALKDLSRQELYDILLGARANICQGLLYGRTAPDQDAIVDRVYDVLLQQGVMVVEVNSDSDINELLGEDGQLRLDNPYNIFVGGQSLDRGITIDHLIGAFYGRDPKTFQMDTVLQHSRMYGSRSAEDLAVTRFYTTRRIYEAMKNMHFIDKELRENLKKNGKIVFIGMQGKTIVPCGPNKVLGAVNMFGFKQFSRLLPIGFQTLCNTKIKATIADIDSKIATANKVEVADKYTVSKMKLEDMKQILCDIASTLEFEKADGMSWDLDAHIAAMERTADESGEVFVYTINTPKSITRIKNSNGGYNDAPDNARMDTPVSKEYAKTTPTVMLLKVKGEKDNGWKDAEFYWPVIVMPENCGSYIYTPDSI